VPAFSLMTAIRGINRGYIFLTTSKCNSMCCRAFVASLNGCRQIGHFRARWHNLKGRYVG
jgi:hypothetical protein